MVEACFLDIKKRGWVLKVCALPLQTYTHTLKHRHKGIFAYISKSKVGFFSTKTMMS